MRDRPFDVLVLGATGVTGRQVARHLQARGQAGLRWAVAGRNRAGLEAVCTELGADVPVVMVDLADDHSLNEALAQTSVLANLVGPYAHHGSAVYDGCIAHGVDQIDVCGEIDWLAGEVVRVGAGAVEARVRIVHTAGFEALPFDLLALLAAETSMQRFGDPLADIDVAISVTQDPPVVHPVDLVSGGTLASGIEALRRGTNAVTADANLLDPQPHEPISFDLRPRRHTASGQWLGPLVPSPHINPPIAYRTAQLTGDGRPGPFAPDYRFREGLVASGLLPIPDSMAALWLSSIQIAGSMAAAAPDLWRQALATTVEQFGPAPGNGPSASRLTGWSWQLTARATSVAGHALDLEARGSGHPGYRSTGSLVAEAATLLANAETTERVGLLTPAAALGTAAIPALATADTTIAVVSIT